MKPTIAELCVRYRCEDAHGEHVARLSNRLFEAMQSELGLTPNMLLLLNTAAHLHDIGYSLQPDERHAAVSAQIVIREGIRGYSQAQTKIIADAIALHQKKAVLTYLKTDRHSRHGLAAKIAAFLRVADGLDHSHIQNAQIANVSLRNQRFTIAVMSEEYRGNIALANEKADLWNHVFSPYTVRFVPAAVGGKRIQAYSTVVRPADTILSAARNLLYLHYRIAGDNLSGASEGTEPERLHDVRTALRRFKLLLRLFAKKIGKRQVAILDGAIDEFTEQLGMVRDLDVWLAFLKSTVVRRQLATQQSYTRFLRSQIAARNYHKVQLAKVLRSDAGARFFRYLAIFLRVELPDRIRQEPPRPLPVFAARRLWRMYEKMLESDRRLPDSPEDIHYIRKQCRRVRYTAEFFAPVLGNRVSILAARLKKISVVLGHLHDCDVGMSRLKTCHYSCTIQLRRILSHNRERLLKESQKQWCDIRTKKTRSSIRKILLQHDTGAAK